jgi:quercetin dioxygenase-like cupin family protein
MSDQAQQAVSGKAAILRLSQLVPRDRGGGARTIPLVTRALGATGFINGITQLEPGAGIPVHSHNCEESVVILEGRAIVEIDGIEHEVGPGDATFLPANIPHRFRNASAQEPMRMLWTYASVEATRTLIATGETRLIEAEHANPAGVRSGQDASKAG